MKYLVSWTRRAGGSAADNELADKRGLDLFGKWSPPSGATFHEFLQRLDGEGGYAVVEADDPAVIAEGPAKFAPLFAFSVVPVADIMDLIPVEQEAIDFRESIS